jgi:DNA-binding transcriptional LysR family regulator
MFGGEVRDPEWRRTGNNRMSERLDSIELFVTAVDAGSFAQAADRLRLTRSAVAKSIGRLERRLGARLFHRTTRTQSLTEEGRAYYERCVSALSELDEAEAALAARRREPTGRLRVSAPVLFGRHCITPVLLQLAQRHPALQIEMSFSDRVVDLIEERFDIAVRVGSLQNSSSLTARRLGSQSMAICAAPSYLSKYGFPKTVHEIGARDCIVYSQGGRCSPWRVRDEQQIRQVSANGRLAFDDLQAIADAAVAGAGYAWLPCWLLAPHVRNRELVLVMDSDRVLATDIHAVWPTTRHLPTKTRVAIDALVESVPAMLGYSGPERKLPIVRTLDHLVSSATP